MSSKQRNYQRSRIESDQNAAKQDYANFINPIAGKNEGIYQAGLGERANIYGKANSFAETGGLDEGDISRLRESYASAMGAIPDFGMERGYLKNFADTGGYTDSDIQRIRAQSASSSPAFYNAIRDQQALARSRSGANAGPTAGLDFKLARAAAQGAAADKLGANIGLVESQRAGKQFGISGLVDTANATADAKMRAASLGAGVEGNIAGMRQSGKQAGIQALQNLYTSNYKPYTDNQAMWLGALGQRDQTNLGYHGRSLDNDQANAPLWQKLLLGLAGSVPGAIGGAI